MKCATLARLRSVGFDVPDGFGITTTALAAGDGAYQGAVRDALRRLRSPWVTRSSSTAEDSETLAFPGLFTTILDISDAYSLFEAVDEVRASVTSDVVRRYVAHHGVDSSAVQMAVLVQTLVPATVAGVAFSRDPVSNDANVVIEANYGLGETVVDGSVTPDSITVSRSRRVVERRLGSKRQKVVTTTLGARVRRADTSGLERSSFALVDSEACAVADLTWRIESELGFPVDVEWALTGDRLQVLQARPITTATPGEASIR
jgi:pyruvate,water dikinase